MSQLQEEAVSVTWKGTKITAKALYALVRELIANRNKMQHGQQTMRKLNLQNRELEQIDLSGQDLKNFRNQLNKYAVDFSVVRDKTTQQYTVFFKSQDVERVYSGLEKCVAGFDRTVKKKPVKEVFKEAEKESQRRASEKHQKSAQKNKAERGQDCR